MGLLTFAGLFAWLAQAQAAPAITVDVQTGAVTHAEEAGRRWAPASLTKLMTAYVTFKALRQGTLGLSSPVVISGEAAGAPPSRMGYASGSVLTVDNALKMLIIKSANDIAVALGQAVSGSTGAFVAEMNAAAAALGMTGTQFANPHGLDDDGQYTTARDIALLALAIRREFPQHAGYFSAEAIATAGGVTPTYNILLGRFDGADGMKTGFVCASGFNIVASATRNGRTIISVVMGALSQKERAEKSAILMEQAFAAPSSGSGQPSLNDIRNEVSTQTADLRQTVCTEEARAQRWDGRQIEGYITFSTPSIRPLERQPVAVKAGLGGAEGASAVAVVLNGTIIGEYPIPAPKPERPTLLEPGDSERFGLRPGFDVPVPTRRPDVRG